MNGKGSVHAPERRRARGALCSARSAKNSSIGRVFPARNSWYPSRVAFRSFGSRISRSSWISSAEGFGVIFIVRPETLNSTCSPGLMPAFRRMLFRHGDFSFRLEGDSHSQCTPDGRCCFQSTAAGRLRQTSGGRGDAPVCPFRGARLSSRCVHRNRTIVFVRPGKC